jgi:DNA mismatch repair ATPase MutS
VFDYKLKEGPTTTRNAIKLLKAMDFKHEITEHARIRAFSTFDDLVES